MSDPDYTGRLTRAPDGTISGHLIDRLGWRIDFQAVRDAEGYALAGAVTPGPGWTDEEWANALDVRVPRTTTGQ